MDDVSTVYYSHARPHVLACPEHEHNSKVVGYQITCIDCHKVFNVGIRGNRRLRCRACHYKKYPSHAPHHIRKPKPKLIEPLPFEEAYIQTHPWLSTRQISEVLGWGHDRAEHWCSVLDRAEPWTQDEGKRVLQEYFACRIIPELSEQLGHQIGAINVDKTR